MQSHSEKRPLCERNHKGRSGLANLPMACLFEDDPSRDRWGNVRKKYLILLMLLVSAVGLEPTTP